MQLFACNLKAENISRLDDPSASMILALGSSYFTRKEDAPGARIILFPCDLKRVLISSFSNFDILNSCNGEFPSFSLVAN